MVSGFSTYNVDIHASGISFLFLKCMIEVVNGMCTGVIVFVVLFFSSDSLFCYLIVVWWCSGLLKLRANSQRHSNQKVRTKDWKSKMMMNMERPFVGHAVRIMVLMSSGFAVTSVRSGSMVNV